ncbi:MAG: response regulator [Candidatus Wallbacteria bacterium]|nr:response regulator [Candidatus Wallbacteria bacterium]
MNEPDPQPASSKSIQVLLIEDSQVDRLVFRSMLEKAGFQVRDTDNVMSGLALLKLGPVDVVVSDVVLPTLSGIDLLRELRRMMPDVPVVLVTSSDRVSLAAEAIHLHAFDFLLKPVLPAALVSAVVAAAQSRHESLSRAPSWPPSQATACVLCARHEVLEFLPSAVLLVDGQGQVLVMNRMAEELLGTCRTDLLGQSFTQLSACPEFVDYVASLIGDRPNADNREVHVPHKDGTTRTLGCSVTPMNDLPGATVGTQLIHFQDISKKVRMEAAMILADKLAALGTMAGALAHDINNPLSVMLGTLGFVIEDLKDTRPELKKSLQLVERNAWNLVEIVRNFLKLSRVGRGERKSVMLDHVISDILALLGKHLAVVGIRVNVEIEPGLPLVEGDETQFQQILLNLIMNARDAMGRDGCLTLRGRRDGAHVVIEVSDTGPGIPPELLDHIFETFFTTKAPGKGTGLGLAICRTLSQGHGGTLDVSTEVGKGATFTLRFPAIEPTRRTTSRTPETPQLTPLAQALNVLAVDDEPEVLEIHRRSLARAGCRGAFFTSPVQALSEFVPGCFDLALIDIRMPEMNGFELTGALLRLDSTLPIVIVSGALLTDIDGEFSRSGAMGYLGKPFRLDSLNEWLELGSRMRATRTLAEPKPAHPQPTYRLLVVDDDQHVCLLLRLGLEATGRFKVETAHDGPAGLAAAFAHPPDLVLLDVSMHPMDGLEVCRRLKADQRTTCVPVVIYSVRMELEDVSRAMQAGASQYLMKPVDVRVIFRELLSLIEVSPGPTGRLELD